MLPFKLVLWLSGYSTIHCKVQGKCSITSLCLTSRRLVCTKLHLLPYFTEKSLTPFNRNHGLAVNEQNSFTSDTVKEKNNSAKDPAIRLWLYFLITHCQFDMKGEIGAQHCDYLLA